ncbi:MAG: tryptophan 7-halogenase [Planctomycetota bacterium]|nr:tryptophan 7-halogenase [Planctomycetota bacterium]
MSNSCDAIVIGGGPAGAAAAAVLAQKGRKVSVFERDAFPRYHVGESAMPHAGALLERLGLLEKMTSAGFAVKKRGMRFVSEDGQAERVLDLGLLEPAAHGWHVVRGEFDKMLLENARSKGAAVYQETEVKEILFENGAAVGVKVQNAKGRTHEWRAPVTLDCSGRDAVAQNRHEWRMDDPELDKVAIWTYLIDEKREPGERMTSVALLPGRGWIWHIPLAENSVSVGVVADEEYLFREGGEIEDVFWGEISDHPWADARLDGARSLGRYFSAGDYSYRAKHCASDGLVLAGDAFAFLDPVFCSGLFLALKSGTMAADAADAALAAGDTRAERFAAYGEELCGGLETLRKLAYAFYDPEFDLLDAVAHDAERGGHLAACLAGDLFSHHEPLFAAIAAQAELPAALDYGRRLAAVNA